MRGIRQLAKHLDISIGTVSRALNNRPDVSPETRKRVLDAAAELGYVPDQSGRSLRQGTTNTVGFMLESGTSTTVGGDNFFMGVIEGVQTVLARHRLDLVMLPCSRSEDPHDYLQRMVARKFVDGIIISATQRQDPRIDLLLKTKLPFITLGRSETEGDYPWIDLDFEGAANHSVDRLVALGHRRIAIAVPASSANLGYIFHDAYRSALARHGIAYDPDLVVRVETSEEGGHVTAERLLALQPQPTAILLIYELMAIGLYRRLEQAGVMPGRDIAVVGFRENPQVRFLNPNLSCYRLSLHDLGIALGEALLATLPQYREAYPLGIVRKVWPMQFIPGGSDAFRVTAEETTKGGMRKSGNRFSAKIPRQ